jgi:SAM-dependent methyltransferase
VPKQDQSDLLQREREFHDSWASEIDVDNLRVEDYFEACTAPENRFILRQLGDLRGKRLLDLGCGAGENSVYFAKRGAACVATDYSPGMVAVALKLAESAGVKIEGKVMSATDIEFADNSFDIVYASNLLHHVPDTPKAVREMHRVLKPGGKACFWDPLKHNPVIDVYRRMATKVRTEDEHPLDIQIVKDARKLFSEVAYDTHWLASLWILMEFYLIDRVHPNQERYWKKIIIEHRQLEKKYYALEKVDRLLKKIPGMKRMAWNLSVVATK